MQCSWRPAHNLASYTPTTQGPAAHRALSELKRCAVMVAVVNGVKGPLNIPTEVNLLLIRRGVHLRRNPGEYAFPGGMFEAIDELDPYACALREWHEEMGTSKPTILGRLDNFHTVSGLAITPVVAWFDCPPVLELSSEEIEEAFYIPISCFKRQCLKQETFERQNEYFKSDVYYWHGQRIWGATAGIIRNLMDVLCTLK